MMSIDFSQHHCICTLSLENINSVNFNDLRQLSHSVSERLAQNMATKLIYLYTDDKNLQL